MRVPDVSLYRDDDYEEVCALVASEEYVPPSYRAELLNGLALVARDERDRYEHGVVGFIWALAAQGNPVAYLDYFVVSKELRGTNAGLWLIGTLSVMLRQMGVKKLVGSVPTGHRAYLRMIRGRGGRDLGLHHVVEMDLGEAVRNGQEHDDDVSAESVADGAAGA